MKRPPDNPAGDFEPIPVFDEAARSTLTEAIRDLPDRLRHAVAGLSDAQLDCLYRNWTIRQITHHLADSHLHSLIRFKWTLTEQHPTIKAYEEAEWVQLPDCAKGDVGPALALVDGLHSKWEQILRTMTEQQFARTFHHPQSGATVSLWEALNYYAWHGGHHTEQILWLRNEHGWQSDCL